MRIEIIHDEEELEFYVNTEREAPFSEHFDDMMGLMAYAQFQIYMSFMEHYGFDPYDEGHALSSFKTVAEGLLDETYERSKDLPPSTNLLNNEEEEGLF